MNTRSEMLAARTIVREVFPSMGAFVEHCEKSFSPSGQSHSSDDTWSGGSWREAIEMATGKGFEDALPEVDSYISHVEHKVSEMVDLPTFESTFDVSGSIVDIARFVEGEPECMIEYVPMHINKQGRIARIIVPITYSSGIPADLILMRGSAVMALVDLMAAANHPMEIWAVMAIHGTGDKRASVAVLVHNHNAPMDRAKVMYALAHPSMLRRLMFACEEGWTNANKRIFGVGGSYGHPSFEVCEADVDGSGPAVVLPFLALHDAPKWTPEAASAWIAEQVDKIANG